MKKVMIMIVSLLILGFKVPLVYAQDAPDDSDEPRVSSAVEVGDVGWIPDPESRFFGLQIAWMNLVENFERISANTDEKKLQLELKYAEKQAKLDLMIQSAMERNPDLVPKLEEKKLKLEEGYQARLARIDERLKKFQERRDNFEEKKDEWVDKVEDRRERLQERRDFYLKRDTENRDRPAMDDDEDEVENENEDEDVESSDSPDDRDLPESDN